MRAVGESGLNLIAEFEGFSPYLYDDPVGHATVGYGLLVHQGNFHRVRGVCPKCDKWARKEESELWLSGEQGRAMLREMVRAYADAVERSTLVPLTQNQFDALTSFTYNVGPGGYINSSVRRAVNAGGDVCAALKQYVKGTNGVIYAGLVRRREAECALYHSTAPNEVRSEDMFIRANGIASFFTGREYVPQKGYEMQLGVDFKHVLPPTAMVIELDIRIDPTTTGSLTIRDGDGKWADELNRHKPQAIVKVIPDGNKRVLFDVNGHPVKFQHVGLVGGWV